MILLALYSDFNISQLIDVIWNALLLRNFGIGKTRIMRQLWYLGTMLFAMHVIYPLLKKHKDNLIRIASPIIIILGLGLVGHNYGNLDVSDNHWLYIINPSLIRTFVDINIGMVIYLLHDRLSKIEYTSFFKILLTILGQALLLLVLFIITFIKNANRYDFIMLLMISISILIITSEKTYDYKILSNRFVSYLEKVSLYIFINHMTLIYFISVMFVNYTPIQKSLLAIVMTLAFSIVEERLIYLFKKNNLNIKKIFIKGSR